MSSPLQSHLSRRNLLKLMGASLALSACAPVNTPGGQQPAAAGGGAASPAKAATELVMMYIAGEIPDPLIKQFNDDYKPIHLTRIDVDPTRFYAMFASGEAPDLVRSMAPDTYLSAVEYGAPSISARVPYRAMAKTMRSSPS